MAAACTWNTCEDSGNDAFIVKFSNGHVKKADKLNVRLYKHTDDVNPRKKSRRIVVAETDRLSYVGKNFGPTSLQCNSMCRYFVGVLDKNTMTMNVHNAQLFNMQTVIPGEEEAFLENTKEIESMREKSDALIEVFGSAKQKRSLTSRRLNEVGNNDLQLAVACAANNVIDEKGVEALQNAVAETDASTDKSAFLPSCNPKAKKPEDVYPFDQLLSPAEFDALKDVGAKMAALTPEDLQKMKAEGSPQSVLKHLELLPKEPAAREKLCRCAWYLSFLINVSKQKRITQKFGSEDGCPRMIIIKVLRNFTVDSFHSGCLKNTVSTSMRTKLASHCLALLLHMGDQKANITLLYRDLGISESKMLEVAKAMGLTLFRQSHEEHRIASLVLPLVSYEQRTERQKRKRTQ